MESISHIRSGTRIANIALIFLGLSILFSSCVGTSYLKDGQELLYHQKIKGAKGMDYDELEANYLQEPNRRIPLVPFAPLVPVYQLGLKYYNPAKYQSKIENIKTKYSRKTEETRKASTAVRDKLNNKMNSKITKQEKKIKEGNLFMRWGEPLAIYKEENAQQTADNLQKYLLSEGYFNATVQHTAKSADKLVEVTYELEKRDPYQIDSVQYLVPDTAVLYLIKPNTLLLRGERYRQKLVTQERDRINDLLLNNGYFTFSRQYVNFELDTAFIGDKKVLLRVIVKNPAKESHHKIYKLDSVVFTSDTNTKYKIKRRQRYYNGITYNYIRDIYSKKILDRRIFLYPDSIYRKSNTIETQKQLSNVDNFKFVNIKYDTTGGTMLAHIFTSPLKRFESSTEGGINVVQDARLPGPFANFSLKHRNTFEGLENIELSVSAGLDALAGLTDENTTYQSFEYGASLKFTFPQFLFPFSKEFKSKVGKSNPKTLLASRFNFTKRPEYGRRTINGSFGYSWQKKNKVLYSLTVADINFIDTIDVTSAFKDTLNSLAERGNTWARSFDPAFVSSSIFTVTIDRNEYGNNNSPSSYIRVFAEAGGNLNNILGDDIFGADISLYKFLKGNVELRHHIPLNKGSAITFRSSIGAAFPYGNIGNDSSNIATLPYEKFFFGGGSSSMRAWQPRRLGPGSYTPLNAETNSISYATEQPAEILIESNVEFRQKLVGFFSWAYFLDIGNVWTWNEDGSRPGSQFKSRYFLGQLAVGTGMGLRLDFSFLLVRLDLGAKIFDPAQKSGDRFVLDKFSFKRPKGENIKVLNQPVLNIGIGYPF